MKSFRTMLLVSDADESPLEMQKRLKRAFKPYSVEIVLTTSCEEAFAKTNDSRSEFDFFVINTDQHNCFRHSFLQYIGMSPYTKEKPKLLINNIFNQKFMLNEDICFTPSTRTIQIKKDTSRLPLFLSGLIKAFVTERPVIYISYGNDAQGDARELIGDFIKYAKMAIPHFLIKCDLSDVKTGQDISTFMRNMKNGDIILLFINERFFVSENTLTELFHVFHEAKDRVYPIFIDSSRKFYDHQGYQSILDNIINMRLESQKKQKSYIEQTGKEESIVKSYIELYSNIIAILPEFYLYARSFFTLPIDTYREEHYIDIFHRIYTDTNNKGYMDIYTKLDDMKRVLDHVSTS